jgi:type IV pilus assembly protein PilB
MATSTTIVGPDEQPLIIGLLSRGRRIDHAALEAAREIQARDKLPLEELLIRKNLATEDEIASAYSRHYLIPAFSGNDWDNPTPQVRTLLPEKLCRDHLIAPLEICDGILDVVFFTPNELLLIEELQLLSGCEIRPCFGPLSVIERVLGSVYDGSSWDAENGRANSTHFEEVDDGRLEGESEDDGGVIHLDQPPPPGRDGRIIRFVNQIFELALSHRASDIHVEPYEDCCRVRLRIDGQLSEISPPPMSMFAPVVSRIKVLAKLDIAEKRLPQDGAISLRSGEHRVDMRVSTCPTVYGEKLVLRVLDKNAIPLNLEDLGLDQRQATDLSASIQMPHGLLLVTGPTGSGKSTTLYACLNRLNRPGVNICTVEDPVEYKFTGINQVQTKTQVGLTFASALRSFLRQDPDVIMVGEVRDAETAQICLRAALTGHLVLSTLHTNSALAAVNRLHDMGIEPFLLASTLRAILAQRLLRRLCMHCRRELELDEETAQRLGIPKNSKVYRPTGCRECRETGYRGRVGIFEVIRIEGQLARLIQEQASLPDLQQTAMSEGVKLIEQSGKDKVRDGLTSLEEALSVAITETD